MKDFSEKITKFHITHINYRKALKNGREERWWCSEAQHTAITSTSLPPLAFLLHWQELNLGFCIDWREQKSKTGHHQHRYFFRPHVYHVHNTLHYHYSHCTCVATQTYLLNRRWPDNCISISFHLVKFWLSWDSAQSTFDARCAWQSGLSHVPWNFSGHVS